MNPREERGKMIASKPNQIVRFDGLHYTVRSQSSNQVYEIVSTERGWSCACPDHVYRDVCCKHIHAVEISLKIRKKAEQGSGNLQVHGSGWKAGYIAAVKLLGHAFAC